MAARHHRRQVLLFLVAVLLPCLTLVVLGLRLAIQEQELARARLADERRSVARALGRELSSRLERSAVRQVGALGTNGALLRAREYDDSSVALVAVVSEGELVLPWEHDEGPEKARRMLADGVFGERMRAAERAEFISAEPTRAAELYRRALRAAAHPVQALHARLFLARSLIKAGRPEDAVPEYRQIATAPMDVVDESGIPLSLYAVGRLLKLSPADTTLLACARATLAHGQWLRPPALYMLADVVQGVIDDAPDPYLVQAARQLAEGVSKRLDRTEQALDLKRVFPRLGLIPVDGESDSSRRRWLLHGSPPWLVGAAPVGETQPPVVVGVRAGPALASLQSGASGLGGVTGEVVVGGRREEAGQPLGAQFPGLSVRFSSPDGPGDIAVGTARWWLYVAGLSLVLGVTLFGAYLLWRDVRREVELAETRSRFVSAVSHELKTPLSAIRMFAETLQLGRPADPAARSEYLDTIVNESERLTRLLNNVLDFSKIEQGRKTYRREETHSLGEIVRSSARAIRYPLEQQGFALHLDVEKNLPQARVDRDAIEQAILNLLANALKYSGDSRDIELKLSSRNGEAVIEVSDRGVGIEPEEHQRIFERFYRVESGTHGGAPGTGLGLTLVRHIVEAHGGRIGVRSTPGEGSTFTLFIPLEGAEP